MTSLSIMVSDCESVDFAMPRRSARCESVMRRG